MYIGIYITNSFISVATVNSDGEAILINDENTNEDKKYLTPLKIAIEDEYAYLGSPVDSLYANDKNSIYAKNFINDLGNEEKTIIQESSGTSWNATALLAVFLKKLQRNIEIYSDKSVKGAFITCPFFLDSSASNAMSKAFQLANIPLLGILDPGRCALAGYDISNDRSKPKQVLLYNLNDEALTISGLSIDEANSIDTTFFKVESALGEHHVVQKLMVFIKDQFKMATKKELKKTAKNESRLIFLAHQIIKQYCFNKNLTITLNTIFDAKSLNLVIPKLKIKPIIIDYLKETITLLIEAFKAHAILIENIEDILFTGTSDLLKIMPYYFEQHKRNPHLKIHCTTTDQIITKGAALLANASIERQLYSILHAEIDIDNSKNNLENKANIFNTNEALSSKIHSMQINAGCDL